MMPTQQTQSRELSNSDSKDKGIAREGKLPSPHLTSQFSLGRFHNLFFDFSHTTFQRSMWSGANDSGGWIEGGRGAREWGMRCEELPSFALESACWGGSNCISTINTINTITPPSPGQSQSSRFCPFPARSRFFWKAVEEVASGIPSLDFSQCCPVLSSFPPLPTPSCTNKFRLPAHLPPPHRMNIQTRVVVSGCSGVPLPWLCIRGLDWSATVSPGG